MAASGLQQGDTVLDLACGAGANLALLEEMVGPEGKVIAVDYSAGMLARAKETAKYEAGTTFNLLKPTPRSSI